MLKNEILDTYLLSVELFYVHQNNITKQLTVPCGISN